MNIITKQTEVERASADGRLFCVSVVSEGSGAVHMAVRPPAGKTIILVSMRVAHAGLAYFTYGFTTTAGTVSSAVNLKAGGAAYTGVVYKSLAADLSITSPMGAMRSLSGDFSLKDIEAMIGVRADATDVGFGVSCPGVAGNGRSGSIVFYVE